MPKCSIAPYLVLNYESYSWREMLPGELRASREAIGWLIQRLNKKGLGNLDYFHRIWDKLDPQVKKLDLKSDNKLIRDLGFGSPIKLSLDLFSELDDCDLDDIPNIIEIQRYIVDSLVCEYTGWGKCKIGINFREVFLLENNQTPPLHYRQGIDILVDNLNDYKKQISTFSYQLAKALFNRFIPDIRTKPTPKYYSNMNAIHPDEEHGINFKSSLKDLQYFSHKVEALQALPQSLFWYNAIYEKKTASFTPVILAFGPGVSSIDLWDIIDNESLEYSGELIIILQGAQYRDPKVRISTYQTALILAQHCKKLLHVILLTREKIPYSLIDLAPDLKYIDNTGFSPLAYGAGYYLSHPILFLMIYRNIQAPTFRTSWFSVIDSQSQRYKDFAPKLIKHNNYIISKEGSLDFRQSKLLDRKALKAKIVLSLTQTLNQEQVLNQTQAINQEQEISQTQDLGQLQSRVQQQNHAKQGLHLSMDAWDFDLFCKKLQSHARQQLTLRSELSLERHICETEYYQQTKNQFFDQIANNEEIRICIAARIFGMTSAVIEGKQCLTRLATYSFDMIESYQADYLVTNIDILIDGINPEHMQFSKSMLFGHLILTGARTWVMEDDGYYDNIKFKKNIYLPNHHLSLLAMTNAGAWQGHSSFYVLLREESFTGLAIDEKISRIALAESLLSIFNSTQSYTQEDIRCFERKFIQLISIYFPGNHEYARIIEIFISIFEKHSTDNLKIMLHPVIVGHKEKMEDFLNLLLFLEERYLLDNFYKVFFRYARTIFSVSELLTSGDDKNPNNSLFIDLAIRTPARVLKQDWPAFEKFFHHCVLFSAKNNTHGKRVDFNKIDQMWRRFFSKCLVYAANQEKEAEMLMLCLVKHMITEDGLSTRPVGNMDTLFTNLDKLIDHAISQHSLHEQLTEISGISLLWLDAPYALAHNGFNVVCCEMELRSDAMNPITKRYSVKLDELTCILMNYKPKDASLKTTLFRYLGTQTLRENLLFYREMLTGICSAEDLYIKELILGLFILNTTGSNYKPNLDKKQFAKDFHAFMEKKTIQESQIKACLQEFFEHYDKTPRDEQKGLATLWTLCDAGSLIAQETASIPTIFTRKFEQKKLVQFVLSNKAEFVSLIPMLKTNQDFVQRIMKATIHAHCKDLDIKHETLLFNLLTKLYPQLDLDVFLKYCVKINLFVENYASIIQSYSGEKIYEGFKCVFEQDPQIETGLALAELLAARTCGENTAYQIDLNASFLTAISSRRLLLTHIENVKPLLELVVEFQFIKHAKDDVVNRLLILTETLMALNAAHAVKTMVVILTHFSTPEWARFFGSQSLTALQLHMMAQLIEQYNPPVSFFELCLAEHPGRDLSDVIDILNDTKPEQSRQLLLITEFICCTPIFTVADQLKRLSVLSYKALDQLAKLIDLRAIDPAQALAVLESPSISNALAQFEQSLYRTNLERYQFDLLHITEKISQIKYKSPDGDDIPLDDNLRKQLVQDYRIMMSYMMTNSVLIENDQQGNKKEFVVNALSEQQCQILFEQLKNRICAKENVHQNKIMLLALCCEVLYRTTKIFPRYTQILCVLHTINHDSDKICEIKTGEGKSITTALHAVLVCAENRTVDIATENNQLASDGLKKFRRFYHYLNVPCGTKIIEAHSQQGDYLQNGINYSIAANLSLFRAQMRLEGKSLPDNSSLICDEIDAMLTTTVQFRLAASLNKLLHDTQSWSYIYRILLDFVKEKEIFTENKCSSQEDISNFRNYFLLRTPADALLKLVDCAPDDLLGTFIESALIAQELEEGVDFVIMPKNLDRPYSYAAPILESTKRPDARISYSAGVHQLLHTLLTDNLRTFEIESASETLVVISAKNFFDYYRLNGGRTIGFTGTAGSNIELQEFYEQNALRVYSYPAFHDDHCEDLGLFVSENPQLQQYDVLKLILDNEIRHPGQPVLIIMPSPKETMQMSNYLMTKLNRPVESYNGDKAGRFEEQVIHQAGLVGAITVATQSLARGTDVEPGHPDGLFVINGCTDLTTSDLRQIKGRPARNGQHGQFCSVINGESLNFDTNLMVDMEDCFKTHQQNMSIIQQKQRLKTRLLEDVRHYVINDYFFGLREHADRILSRQYGLHRSLIEQPDFLMTIRNFNDNVEQHYQVLLDQAFHIDVDVFFDAVVDNYQRALNRWLPENKFKQVTLVEPLIPLDKLKSLLSLDALNTGEFSIISGLLAEGWKYAGHQTMQTGMIFADHLEDGFEPYFNGKLGFKHVLIETLIKLQVINVEKMFVGLDAGQKQGLEMISSIYQIPVIGSLIPVDKIKHFLLEYVSVTKMKIQEEKWDALAIPNFSQLSDIFSGIGSIFFVVNQILMPVIKFSLTMLFKQLFSNSESLHLQMLLGLDTILSDVSNVLNFGLSISDMTTITVGQYLDNIGPLLKNKTFLLVMGNLLENNNQLALIPYLQTIIEDLMSIMESYRDKRLLELQSGEVLMGIFLKICQLEPVKKAFDSKNFNDIADQISTVTPEFLARFDTLTIQELTGLVKVMAHPEFSKFLKALPMRTSFADMKTWLDLDSHLVPVEAQNAIQNLKDYQSNRERVCEDNKQSLLSLNEKFKLSKSNLQKHLSRLAPHLPVVSPSVETPVTPVISWRIIRSITLGLLGLGIVLLNVAFFSIPLVLITALIGLTLAYYHFNSPVVAIPNHLILEEDAYSIVAMPISILVHHPVETLKNQRYLQDSVVVQKGLERYGVFSGDGTLSQLIEKTEIKINSEDFSQHYPSNFICS